MYKFFLHLLKLGSLLNIYFLWRSFIPPLSSIDTNFLIPAQILFIVSAYRCFFPVNYITNAVLHDFPLSSIFFTRSLATVAEVAYIYQFSQLIRFLNGGQISFVDVISWLMVVQVVISQFFVWHAILMTRSKSYFYEEVGWWFIFFINTTASGILYFNFDCFIAFSNADSALSQILSSPTLFCGLSENCSRTFVKPRSL